ncbi:MAG: GntR family transcriptional regulator [Proteobacteria bacterium]|nr:GntR family transcriptional regulator [Pseudomonadota bacterium]
MTQLEAQPALIDQVHDRVVAAIVDGTLEPGRRLTQDELAELLGVSRQPVSHAIQVLRRRGLLVESGKRGVSVAALDANRISQLYQVRAALDGLAAELAAERCRTGAVTSTEIEALETAHAAGQLAASRADPDYADLVDRDVAFHSALHQLSGNLAIVETVADQWPHFRRSMRYALAGPESIARVWREHALIAEAVLAGKAAKAAEFARAHAERASADTVRRLEATAAAS